MQKYWSWIIIKNKRILLIKRAINKEYEPEFWSFPWWWNENGETIEETAIREVKEEVWLDFYNLKLFKEDTVKSKIWSYYVCKFLWEWKWKISIQEEECDWYWWFSYNETKKLKINKNVAEILEKLREEGIIWEKEKNINFKEKFDSWNEEKKKTNEKKYNVFFKERDIFFIKAGKNIGFEQNWKWEKFARPFLIIRKFNNQIFWGIPLSSKEKNGKYYHNFSFKNTTQTAILSQIKLIDSKRIMNKIGMIDNENYSLIKEKIKSLL